MANIKLNDLSTQNISGSDLFEDSESFLTELNDESNQVSKDVLVRVIGGVTCFCGGGGVGGVGGIGGREVGRVQLA
jgi:hypothetical protein